MYISRPTDFKPDGFPPNYNGNLMPSKKNEDVPFVCEKSKYKYRKYAQKKIVEKKECSKPTESYFNDNIVLIGLLVFLYVGCEHTKENLILMGIIAYLLIGCQD